MKLGFNNLGWGAVCTACIALLAGCGASGEDGVDDGPAVDSAGRTLSGLAREIVARNTSAAEDMNLIARVEVRPGELLEFYELAPGQIMLSGAGAPQGTPVQRDAEPLIAAADYAALWDRASGGAPMPAPLAEALERRAARTGSGDRNPRSEVETRAAGVDPGPAFPQRAPVIGGWCQTGYYNVPIIGYGADYTLGYCEFHSYWSQQECWNNVTGDGWASNGDAGYVISNVCPYRGAVTFSVEADEDWITRGSWTVAEDNYRWMRADDLPCDTLFDDCPYVRTSVLNASGDGYNYRFLAHDP